MDKIKRLIIDWDNTIMMWKDKYLIILEELIKKYNLNVELYHLNLALEYPSMNYKKISKQLLIKAVNEVCKIDVTEDFINDWLAGLGKVAVELEPDIVETLEYLYSKYSLVVHTNFITECQKERAKTAGIDKYFEDFCGAEKVARTKPHKDSFNSAIGSYLKEECIAIGDDMITDIGGALCFGIKAIFLDRKNEENGKEEKPYITIKKFSDLMNIL